MPPVSERLSAALADRYRIERELGQGGMATVYLAQDLKHDRKVALKVLKSELAAVLGADRFVVEIKTTASLQHPHILPLFDSGTADGFLYYVMPYIDGETLRAKLDRETQLGIDEAVRLTIQVAEALDYAHRHGVIHRDIKPENILLHDGRPMVADFGIALAVSAAAGGRMTETGLSLGTPHYMSPEQATAEKEITGRSDIYSLGSVLYETLTGNPPHTGASAQQIIMKIIADTPRPVAELRKSVPPNVAAAVGKALEKLPADRFERANQLAEALGDPHFTTRAEGTGTAGGAAARVLGLPVAARWVWAAGLIAVGGTAGWLLRSDPAGEAAPVTRFTVPVPGGHDMAILPNLAVSPDGRTLAYFVDGTLYRRRLERDDPEPLGNFAMGCCPEFSRDGRSVLIRRSASFSGTEVWSVPVDGGSVVDLSSRPIGEDIVAASWNRSGLFLRRAGDTTWTVITALDSAGVAAAHLWPQLLEGGRSVLFTILGPSMMWHDATIVVQDLESGERTTIVSGGTYGRYVPTGHVVYIRADGTVEAVPFGLRRRRVTGSALTVEAGVRTGYWGGAGSFAVSDAGTFVFVRGSSWQRHRLTWVNRQGSVLGHVGEPVTAEGARLSPDERYVVTYVASPSADIARFDVATGEQRRLTFDMKTEDNPTWSPDGRRVTYRQIVTAYDQRILTRSADGQGAVEQVYASPVLAVPLAWSLDGSALAIGGSDVLVLHLASQRLDTVSKGMGYAQFSPDGRWLAYTSSETGREEVYVTPFPGLTAKQQISMNGGRFPQWSARSGELFFLAGDTLMASSASTRNGFDWTTPRPLFARPDLATLEYGFAVSADGRRFLYPARNPDASPREIHVVLNWLEELKAGTRR